jgi:hypothetical protein
MTGFRRFGRWGFAVLFCGMVSVAPARELNEQALLKLWTAQSTSPEDHAAVIQACTDYAKANPADPGIPVSRTLAAWHLLKLGKTEESAALFKPYLKSSSDPIRKGASLLAKAWMTRFDALAVKEALQLYYRREFKYPRTLMEFKTGKALKDTTLPPLADRWGLSWSYKLAGFKHLPNMLDQKYELQSSRLGGTTDFKKALAIPYGEELLLQVGKVRTVGENVIVELVRVERSKDPLKPYRPLPGSAFMINEGRSSKDIFLAYVGSRMIILAGLNHWTILPRPGH